MNAARPRPPAVVAVTMGEPAGIGVEIAAKAWRARVEERLPPFFLIAAPDIAARAAAAAGIETEVVADPESAAAVFSSSLPVLPVALAAPVTPGAPDPVNAPAILEAIDIGVEFAISGRTAGIVTGPIHKETLYAAGFGYPGHTEYLAHLAGEAATPVMMLVCAGLRVVPVTVHLGLKAAIAELTAERIVSHGLIVDAALRTDFGIAAPRIAVAALNPHGGEGGALGDEESSIIAPAVATLRARGINVFGPESADTLFHETARAAYDAVLCMYHDQALIPIKTVDFWRGVNITLGLPFVRTSPDHGTALDIAGTGTARADSLISALIMADCIARRRLAAAVPAAD